VLIGGENGIGKTALAETVSAQAKKKDSPEARFAFRPITPIARSIQWSNK
jgi:MoxR-like ATPase